MKVIRTEATRKAYKLFCNTKLYETYYVLLHKKVTTNKRDQNQRQQEKAY